MRSVGTLAAAGITKSHGAHVVLNGVDLVVPPQARIGLVGPNGAGKSTLLGLLAGEEQPDRGTVRRNPPSLAVGHLPQERDPLAGETLHAYLARRTGVAAAAERMDDLAARLAAEPELAGEYHDALDAFLARGGGDLDARAAAVLADLGLSVELDRPLDALSGGESARAALASILLSRFDVLLLDEPTNDLDFAGLARLESFVAGVRRLDRRRLARPRLPRPDRDADRRARRVDARRARVRRRLERVRGGARAAAGAPVRELGGVRRRARPDRGAGPPHAAVGGARLRAGAQEEEVEGREEGDREANRAARRGGQAVRAVGAAARSGARRHGAATSSSGSNTRASSAAPSPSARSTWRCAGASASPSSARTGAARRRCSTRCSAACRSTRARAGPVPASCSASWSSGARRSPAASRSSTRSSATAGCRRRRRERCSRSSTSAPTTSSAPRGSLSPGERTRAVLALLSARGVNCLVLDEPTNHLDVEAIEELERALAGYGGTVLLVTHDRLFLERFGATRTVAL